MGEDQHMIPIYYIEDLSIADVEDMIEKGVVFDVTSKATVLSADTSDYERESFWGPRNKPQEYLRPSNSQ